MPKDHSKSISTKKQSIPNKRTDLLKQVLLFIFYFVCRCQVKH